MTASNSNTAKRNVNRIDHVLFAYQSFERAEETRQKMTSLLGLHPDAWEKPATLDQPFNLRASLCWDAGLEIISPLEGCEDNWFGAQLIAERGEGICAVVFGVQDLDQACRRAEQIGLPVAQRLQDPRHPDGPEEIEAGIPYFLSPEIVSPFHRLREGLIGPFNGTGLAFGDIETLANTAHDDVAATQAVLERMYAAIAAGDSATFFDSLADDVVVTEPRFLPYGGTWTGKQRVIEMLGQIAAHTDLTRLSVEHLVVQGDRGFAVLRVGLQGSDAELIAAEESVVRDGKVVQLRIFIHDAGHLVSAPDVST